MPKTTAKGKYTKVGMDIDREVDINKDIDRWDKDRHRH